MDPWRVHGGRIDAARRSFPDAEGPWIDLSTGINPIAWEVAQAGPIDWARLPAPAALDALEAAAADHFGVAADQVCAMPGSELGLRLLDALAPPPPWRHAAQGYGTHGEALPGSRPVPFDRLEAEAARGGTLLFANPANPDGRLLGADALARIRAAGATLIVDEAFADAVPGCSVAGSEGAIVLRSFGKFFGLAGLRLGFVVAAPGRLAALRRRLGSWPVSAAAIAIGTAAYRDTDWIAATRIRLHETGARLDALLARHGLAVEGMCPLFRLVRTTDAARLFTHLAHAGILTRPFADHPDRLRLGLPADDAAFDRLDRALADG